MRYIPTILATATIGLAPMLVLAPAANAGGPCAMAGQPQQTTAQIQACTNCMASNGNDLQASGICGVPPATALPCAQAGVCGNAYRHSGYLTSPCLPNSPIEDCVPPGTFPTAKVPNPGPIGRLPGGDTYTPHPDDPWGSGN